MAKYLSKMYQTLDIQLKETFDTVHVNSCSLKFPKLSMKYIQITNVIMRKQYKIKHYTIYQTVSLLTTLVISPTTKCKQNI